MHNLFRLQCDKRSSSGRLIPFTTLFRDSPATPDPAAKLRQLAALSIRGAANMVDLDDGNEWDEALEGWCTAVETGGAAALRDTVCAIGLCQAAGLSNG